MERKKDHLSLKQALDQFIELNKLQAGFDKIEARQAWISLMGQGVNKYTTDLVFKGDTLYVSLSSSVLREELSLGKTKIIRMLNDELGKELIKKLVLR